MKLFLAAEAKHPESLKKLEKFVGGFEDKRIMYVPTAMNGRFYGKWKDGESVRLALSLGAEVVELEESYYRDVIGHLAKADILWFSGGVLGYLMHWVRRIELDKVLSKIYRKGTVHVGSSSGSMMCSQTLHAAAWYLGDPEPGVDLAPGLGFIDFEVYPHYDEKYLPEIKKRWKKGELCLLKDGEAITVVDGKVEVLGEKRVVGK